MYKNLIKKKNTKYEKQQQQRSTNVLLLQLTYILAHTIIKKSIDIQHERNNQRYTKMIRSNGGGGGGGNASSGGAGATSTGMGGAAGGGSNSDDGCIYPDEVIMEKGVAFNVRVCIYMCIPMLNASFPSHSPCKGKRTLQNSNTCN